jgi:O-antigen ligase
MEMTLQGRFAAMVGDANEYSQIVLVSIGCLIYSLQFLNTTFQKGISIILIVYLSIKGISSNSKSYVLTLFIMLALVILFYLTSVLKNKGVYSFIVQVIPIMIVGIIGLLYVYNDMILPVLEARAEENTGFFTGRDRIWSEYSKALSQRLDVLFIGDGAGNVTFLNNYNSLDHEVPHNTYLEYLIQFGILGLISLIGTFNKVFKQLFENKTIYAFLPLGAFLITAFAISANASDCLFIVLLFIAVPIHKLKT